MKDSRVTHVDRGLTMREPAAISPSTAGLGSKLGCVDRNIDQPLNAGSLELGKEGLQYRLNVAQEEEEVGLSRLGICGLTGSNAA